MTPTECQCNDIMNVGMEVKGVWAAFSSENQVSMAGGFSFTKI
jgi:hypothetical protein